MRFRCMEASDDWLDVGALGPCSNEGVSLMMHDSVVKSHDSVVNLSSEDAMNLAAHIVRLVHGERKPRVWNDFHAVPDRVEVKTGGYPFDRSPIGVMKIEGSTLVIDSGSAELWDFDLDHPNDYAPFTEVL